MQSGGISLVVLGMKESGRRMKELLKKAYAGRTLLQSVFSFVFFGPTCVAHDQGCLIVALMIVRPMVMLSLDAKKDE